MRNLGWIGIITATWVSVSFLRSTTVQAAPVPPAKSPYGSTMDQVIRVRIAPSVGIVAVRGLDLSITDARGTHIGTRNLKQTLFYCRNGKIQAVSVESGKSAFLIPPVRVDTPAGFLSVNSNPLREAIVLYSNSKTCEVVNHLSIEKYLIGLVNAEFSSKWSPEAIGAQVIAARSYAFYKILESQKRHSHFDVESTVADQVYEGPLSEDHLATHSVQKTRGVVLMVQAQEGLKPLKAFYHSTCGGETELPENVWGTKQLGFKRRVRCLWCRKSPRFQWNARLSSREILDGLSKGARAEGVPAGWPADWSTLMSRGQLVAVNEVLDPSVTRNSKIHLSIRDGSVKNGIFTLNVTAARFRAWLGNLTLKSTRFQIMPANGKWKVHGVGNGHGVGMCQWGAKTMGERGYRTTDILKNYYPDAVLKKLW